MKIAMSKNNKGGLFSTLTRITAVGGVMALSACSANLGDTSPTAGQATDTFDSIVSVLEKVLSAESGNSASPESSPAGQTDRPYQKYVADSMDTLENNIGTLKPSEKYKRDKHFPTWLKVDDPNAVGWDKISNTSCDVKDAVRITYGTNVKVSDSCKVTGTWTDMYGEATPDGRVTYAETTDPSKFHIEHVVPLSLAWKSGADKLSQDEREQIANGEANLLLAEGSINMSKGDRSIDKWMLPRESKNYCNYADRYAYVKAQHKLKVSKEEYEALKKVVNECS